MISVIIPVKNDFTYLTQVLDNLYQGANPQEFEIILVNDGSVHGDNTPMSLSFDALNIPM